MIRKYGTANWRGNLEDGTGSISTESGVLDRVNYGFNKRFQGEPGSNPEELIGAAHAACFSMALSNILGEEGIVPDNIDTKSTISLDMSDGPKIVGAHLDITLTVDGDRDQIMGAVKAAEQGCPVSMVLDCEITSDVTFR